MNNLDIRMTDFEDSQETEFPVMLVGKDYPELCNFCRSAIDACFAMLDSVGDYDREDCEVPCNMAYDQRMFCGKHTCVNKPGQTQGIDYGYILAMMVSDKDSDIVKMMGILTALQPDQEQELIRRISVEMQCSVNDATKYYYKVHGQMIAEYDAIVGQTQEQYPIALQEDW